MYPGKEKYLYLCCSTTITTTPTTVYAASNNAFGIFLKKKNVHKMIKKNLSLCENVK